MRRLRELYRNLLDPSSQQTNALWPHPTPDPPGSAENLPTLEYVAKIDRTNGTELAVIDEENERHAMYLARMQIEDSTQNVFVKFTYQVQ